MKTEIIFALCSAGLCAAMLWCMVNMREPFFVCVSAFTAAFWGSLAALVVWSRICERERKNEFRFRQAPITMPNRRR